MTFELGSNSGWEFPRGEKPRCGPSLQVHYGTDWFWSPAMGAHRHLAFARGCVSLQLPFWDSAVSPLTLDSNSQSDLCL